MKTPKQLQASRTNGAKSKGPVTPQGKRNSSRNRTRHGMFADTILLEAEDKSQFLDMLVDLFAEYQPRTRMESMLVQVLAAARWRQDRIFGMQRVAFDYDIDNCTADEINPLRAVLAMRTPDSARSHELLVRYEVALDRQVSRTLLRLERLQARELPKESAKEAGHSVLRESEKRALVRTVPADEPIAPPPVLPDPKKTAPEVRTQQPVEAVVPPHSPSVQTLHNTTPKNRPSPPSLPATRRNSSPVRKKPAA